MAQSCSSGADLDVPTKNAVEAAARQYLDMSTRGDVAGLKANSIPAIAGDFGSIEQAVVTNKQYLAQGPATVSGTYLLDASQAKGALPRADFYCGIYNSPDRLVFSISNLPAGRYALVMQKIAGKDPITLTLILQDVNGSWKLAGYYPRLDAIGGHDGQWYLAKAREYKSKEPAAQCLVLLSDSVGPDGPGELHEYAATRQDRRRNAERAAGRPARQR